MVAVSPLPKHLRPRWRYLGVAVQSWPDVHISRSRFQEGVETAARALLGDATAAQLGLRLYEYRFDRGVGEAVIRTRRGTVDQARAALACLTELDGAPLGVRVRGVSGTVRGCEESYLGRRPESSGESTVVFAGTERPAVRRGDEVEVRMGDGFVGATTLDLE